MLMCGYARVSTDGQTLETQVTQLRGAGAVRVFKEKVSGARADRVQLRKAVGALHRRHSSSSLALITSRARTTWRRGACNSQVIFQDTGALVLWASAAELCGVPRQRKAYGDQHTPAQPWDANLLPGTGAHDYQGRGRPPVQPHSPGRWQMHRASELSTPPGKDTSCESEADRKLQRRCELDTLSARVTGLSDFSQP
jgi:Resolvase, N terminal domain